MPTVTKESVNTKCMCIIIPDYLISDPLYASGCFLFRLELICPEIYAAALGAFLLAEHRDTADSLL